MFVWFTPIPTDPQDLIFPPIVKSLRFGDIVKWIDTAAVIPTVMVGPHSHKSLIDELAPLLGRMATAGQLTEQMCATVWRAVFLNDDAESRKAARQCIERWVRGLVWRVLRCACAARAGAVVVVHAIRTR